MLDGSLQASLSRGPGLFQGPPPHCRIIFGTNRRNGRQVHTGRVSPWWVGLGGLGDPPPRPHPLSDNKVEPLTTLQKACSNLQVPACLVWRQAPVETRGAVFLFSISRAGVDVLCCLVPCQLYHSSLCAADWHMRPHTFTMPVHDIPIIVFVVVVEMESCPHMLTVAESTWAGLARLDPQHGG